MFHSKGTHFWKGNPVLSASHDHQDQPSPGKEHVCLKAICEPNPQVLRISMESSIFRLLFSDVPELGNLAAIGPADKL